ncbi:MAG: YeeE/YedE family protein [Methylotenera sp.]|uniref:DUF6691 family protein n=1 Tax=Methylotenera sp. TaxID=2051956 RepID=UPI00248807D6|nr:DUF6691 family protein [Methylotenera sp.]MDI1310191.1 YeeE/YedE family protein [Methylotenera sp.]
MILIYALMSGLLFGLGLIISGMSNPAKVIGFLDITGQWDPSLAFVMLGAISVAFLPFKLAKSRSTTFTGQALQLPCIQTIDLKFILGSITFGIGWGLAGYCPGPALNSVLTGYFEPVLFVISILSGMGIFEILKKIRPPI